MILIHNSDEYWKWLKRMKRQKNIVFFNGCFDIVHLGHIKMLNAPQFDNCYKIIGLNSDLSVKLQNKSHPLINDEEYRSKFVSNFCMDVIIFDSLTPTTIIKELMPDFLVKGKDYEGIMFPEKFIVDKYGGQIVYFDSGVDMSTTKLFNRIGELYREA